MRCLLCKQGEARGGKVTVTLQRGETTIIIKEVLAEICENCGEYYLEEQITDQILVMAEEAVKKNVEVEILRFAAQMANLPKVVGRFFSCSNAAGYARDDSVD